ncbi:MAG: sigma-70 family RNA polymerase sigma factor [Ruminococcus sp.]|nr:sigma-70 family RNA polymerase sigma factor [Ruminococcus sp.]
MDREEKALAEFRTIYSSTCKYVFRAAVAGSRSVSDAEDVFQETYVELLSQLRRGKTIRDPQSYLTSILRRKLWASYQSSPASEISSAILDFSDAPSEPPDDLDIEESIITEQLYEQVAQRLRSKDETVRRIFYMYYSLEMKLPDIAEQLDIPLQSVKNKLYRTLAELRKLYGGDK